MSATPGPRADPVHPTSPMAGQYRVVTIALVTLTTMVAFETMAVTTAMPSAAAELGAVGSYGLAFSSMMTAMLLGNVLAGSWADRYGPLRGMYAGQSAFALGIVVCAVAPSWGLLLAGRVIAGLGAGLLIVTEFVAVGRVYPAALRPKVFTWISAAWVLPSVLGAPAAGFIAEAFTWRWVFGVILAPAVLTALLITARRRALDTGPGSPVEPESGLEAEGPALDAAGSAPPRPDARPAAVPLGAGVAVSAGLVQLAINEQSNGGPWVAWTVAAATIGLFGIALFAPRLVPPGTVRAARGLPAVILSRGLFNASFMASVTFLPLLLVQVYGLSLPAAGLVVATGAIGWASGSWLQGRVPITTTAGRARLVWLGASALALATLGLAHAASIDAIVPVYAVWVALCGLGMGTGSTTLSVLVLELAPEQEHGQASAALQLSDVLGSVLGIAGATAVFGAGYQPGDPGVFVVISAGLAAVAALAVVTGRRCALAPAPAR